MLLRPKGISYLSRGAEGTSKGQSGLIADFQVPVVLDAALSWADTDT